MEVNLDQYKLEPLNLCLGADHMDSEKNELDDVLETFGEVKMISKELKKQIQSAFEYCLDEIEESGDYEEHYCDSDITDKDIADRAKSMLANNLYGYDLPERDEVVNCINNKL